MLEVLSTRFHAPRERISIAGYADNAPLASNDTEEGRARNRRVDIVILSEQGVVAEPGTQGREWDRLPRSTRQSNEKSAGLCGKPSRRLARMGTMIQKVRKAVFPAAGLGTRFLPATKAQPKEMLPLVDKPLIQYGVEEAMHSGVQNIIIVTGRGKSAIEDHFDVSFELEHLLETRHKKDLLATVRASRT